jgi:hypothetical protein
MDFHIGATLGFGCRIRLASKVFLTGIGLGFDRFRILPQSSFG